MTHEYYNTPGLKKTAAREIGIKRAAAARIKEVFYAPEILPHAPAFVFLRVFFSAFFYKFLFKFFLPVIAVCKILQISGGFRLVQIHVHGAGHPPPRKRRIFARANVISAKPLRFPIVQMQAVARRTQ